MEIRTALNGKAIKAGFGVLCCALAIVVSGCAAGHNPVGVAPTPTPTPTPVATPTPTATPTPAAARLLVSDNTSGTVNVVNGSTDLVTNTIAVPSPGKMISASGTTLIQSTLSNSVTIFDNATETVRFNVVLPAQPVDIALTPDGNTAWVAETDGNIQSISTATGTIARTISSTGVQRLVMGPQGTTVLAFNDTLAITIPVIVPTSNLIIPIGNSGLDHPASGFFNVDDNHFEVLNCGVECGGTQAGIAGVVLNTPGGPFVSTPLALSGATVGLLNGSTDFVAGSPTTGLNAGKLQVVNNSTLTVGSPFSIADGRHNLMSLTSNGRLYIGSTGCTLGVLTPQNVRQGCLTIFDTVAQTVTPVLLSATRSGGDVTGMAPVPGRNVIYVVQGATLTLGGLVEQGSVLDIFDTTTNAVSTTAHAPVFPGSVFDVVQLAP